jgi:hypothetical protein
MHKETQAVVENIARIIAGHHKFKDLQDYRQMTEMLEKFLITLEEYNDE